MNGYKIKDCILLHNTHCLCTALTDSDINSATMCFPVEETLHFQQTLLIKSKVRTFESGTQPGLKSWFFSYKENTA